MSLPALCTRCAHLGTGPSGLPCSRVPANPGTRDWLIGMVVDNVGDPAGCPTYSIALSPDQEAAIQHIVSIIDTWEAKASEADTAPTMVLTGPAGSGKTTIMLELLHRLRSRNVALLAPTGTAAKRLRATTRMAAQTVHSFVYARPTEKAKCPGCGGWSAELAETPVQARRKSHDTLTCPSCAASYPIGEQMEVRLFFQSRKAGGDDEEMAPPDLVLVDEASMCDTQLSNDLRLAVPAHVPILYVGDREQLPPVVGTWGPDFDNPTAVLETVHRQAAESPILTLATRIRRGDVLGPQQVAHDPGGRVALMRQARLAEVAAWAAEQREEGRDVALITYTNDTRNALNALVRRHRGLVERAEALHISIVPGDRLLVRANNPGVDLMNGDLIDVAAAQWMALRLDGSQAFSWDAEDTGCAISVTPAGGGEPVFVIPALIGGDRRVFRDAVDCAKNGWSRVKAQERRRLGGALKGAEFEEHFVEWAKTNGLVNPARIVYVEWGECLTCHTAQGHGFELVGIVWDRPTWGLMKREPATGRRWFYTAVTRAIEQVVLWLV